MRVVVTGQSGLAKRDYLEAVKTIADKHDEKLEIFSVGQRMIAEREKATGEELNIDRILNLPYNELSLLRRLALSKIIEESKVMSNCILDTHAVFRWRNALMPAFDIDQLHDFNPEMFVTLIDDVDNIYKRIQEKEETIWKRQTIKDIIVWREEEIAMTDVIADLINADEAKKVPHYVLTRSSDPEVLYKLMFMADQMKVYASFPISGMGEKELKETEEFKKTLSKHFIVFDPYTITEKRVLTLGDTFADEISGYLEDDKIDLCLKSAISKKEKTEKETREEKPWKFPKLDAAKRALANEATIFYPRDEEKRSVRIQDLQQISGNVDGQIESRDLILIRQSNIIIVYILIEQVIRDDKLERQPHYSPGCQTELTYAHSIGKDVYVICELPNKLSPWVTNFCTVKPFLNTREAMEYLEKKGYIVK